MQKLTLRKLGLSPLGVAGGYPSQPLKTGQDTKYQNGDDGDANMQMGVAREYEVLTTGQYAGTTNIIVQGRTCALSNNVVRDKKTGLMWARYPLTDIGPGADGQLFWEKWTLTGETCTFNAAGKTITADAGTPFDVNALCVGRKFSVAGSVNNNNDFTVAAIANNVITVNESVTDESSVSIDIETISDLIWDVAALDGVGNYIGQANVNSLAGYDDWRIPNCLELLTLLDLGEHDPCINTTAFPSTPSSFFWTSTTRHDIAANAIRMYFSYYTVSSRAKATSRYYLRLVRG